MFRWTRLALPRGLRALNGGRLGALALGTSLGVGSTWSWDKGLKGLKGLKSSCEERPAAGPRAKFVELTAAEIRRHEKVSNFSACRLQGGSLCCSWVHTRGRLDPQSTDGGKDLLMMRDGEFPQVATRPLRGNILTFSLLWSLRGSGAEEYFPRFLLRGQP